MNFAVLAPEITSAQMYSGAGSGPMLGAAAAWTGLSDELGSAADCFGSVTAGLAGGPWQGPSSVAMTAVAAKYAGFLGEAATRAATAAAQANAVAGIFEAAKAAVAHPMTVRTNRVQFVSAVRSNFLGLNGPLIAAIEGAYDELWAQNVSALASYHGAASAAAAQIAPWQKDLADVSTLVGRLNAANGATLAATATANAAEISGAARFTRDMATEAGADLSAGRVMPAVQKVGSAIAYDAQAAGNVLARTASVPAQLVGQDLEILASSEFGESLRDRLIRLGYPPDYLDYIRNVRPTVQG
ncbi:MAG: PPE family protein [Mycobacterium sp.]|nr:MAG: PPE family protein [Mycobacterium sp.]